MRIACGIALAVVGGGTVAGQEQAATFSFREAFAAIKERDGMVASAERPIERVRRIVNSLLRTELQTEGLAAKGRARRRTVVSAAPRDETLLVSGDTDVIELVDGIHEQLGKAERRELHVECSLLTLPRKLATAHGIPQVAPHPVDEAAAGRLIKAAVGAAKGTLRNLPLAKVEPFVPFSIRSQTDGKKNDGKPEPLVRGEALLIHADEAVFAVQVEWPDVASEPAKTQRGDRTFRLKAGSGVMMMVPIGKQATKDEQVSVVWVRLAGVEVRKAGRQEPVAEPRGK